MLKRILLVIPLSFSCITASDFEGEPPHRDGQGAAARGAEEAAAVLDASGYGLSDEAKRNLDIAANLLDNTGAGQALQSAASSAAASLVGMLSDGVYKMRGYEKREIIKRRFKKGGWAYFISCGMCGHPPIRMEEVEVQWYLAPEKTTLGVESIAVIKTFTRRRNLH